MVAAARNDANWQFWRGRRVLVTGHMGFKGAWFTSMLARLGAITCGFGRDDRSPLLYPELRIANHIHTEADLRNGDALTRVMSEFRPEILFHLAAQPIVITSYRNPLATFEDNVMGTARVLEAARYVSTLKAVVIVTSDKVYKNDGSGRPHVEDDMLGGSDPYSASKAAAEIVAAAFSASYFDGADKPKIATARAGNVIGGGDWAEYRLLPDAARALSAGKPLIVRNPAATRPWQHVIDPLRGYAMLAEHLTLTTEVPLSACNFGPEAEESVSVGKIADLFIETWGQGARWQQAPESAADREAVVLAIDSSRARSNLGWRSLWGTNEAVARTALWYRDYAAGVSAQELVDRDLAAAFSA